MVNSDLSKFEPIKSFLTNRMGKKCEDLIASIYSDSFTLKGKRVDINGSKYKYEDFFKLSVNPETKEITGVHKSNGVDVLAFAVFGLCLNLANAGDVYTSLLDDDNLSSNIFIDLLDNFVSSKFDEDLTSSEIELIKARYSRYSTKEDLSLADWQKEYDADCHKSMYFAESFGNSTLSPNNALLNVIFPKLMCLALKTDADKYFTEIFCAFREVICLGGLTAIVQDGDELKNNSISSQSGVFDTGYSLKLSNTIGVSRNIALALVSDIADCIFLPKEVIDLKSMLTIDLGNDVIADYLFGRDAFNYLESVINNDTVKVKVSSIIPNYDKSFNIRMSTVGVWLMCICLRQCANTGVSPELVLHYRDTANAYLIDDTWYRHMIKEICLGFVSTGIEYSRSVIKQQEFAYDSLKKQFDNANSTISNLRCEITELTNRLKATVTESDTVSKLEHDLVLQKSRSDELVLQVEDLRLKLQDQTSAFDDLLHSLEVQDTNKETEISLEDMVEMLNGFRLCFIGGRTELTNKLNALGLHNFIQANDVSDISRLDSFDFVVSMTSFLSHNLFYFAMNKLGSDRSRHMYFNGTNLNNLIQSCYEFILGYFEING